MDAFQFFGNPNTFAVSHCPDFSNSDIIEEGKMAICHIVIDNIIIGNSNEVCYLQTCFSSMVKFRDFIQTNKNTLYNSSFNGLTNREIFELVIKTNQLEDEFDKQFLYLPQLDNSIWNRHYLTIDETIDGFGICFYIKNEFVTFIITNWGEDESKDEKSNLIIKTVDLSFFINTLDDALVFLENRYPYLTNHK